MENQGSGKSGIFIILLCSAILYFVKRLFPRFASAFVSLAELVILGFAVLVVVVLYFAFSGSKKKKSVEKAGAAEASPDAIHAKGRRNLTELRMRAARIKNGEVRKVSQDICATAEKILKTVQEKPEKLPAVRQFLNYYLPTLGSILEKYVRLEESGVPTADMTEKTIDHLRDISAAMQKQYESLFAGDLLDLSVEMEALTQACKRDGLLTEEDVTLQDGEKNITLTL